MSHIPRMSGGMIRNHSCSIGQLPGDEQAALAANLHSGKSLIEAWNQTPHALGKRHGLRISELWFAVLAHHRLAVLVLFWGARVVERGVELDAICRTIACVVNLVQLARLGIGAGADLGVLEFERERGLQNAFGRRHSGRQLDGGSSGLWGRACRFGGGDGGFGGSLGTSSKRGCRHKEEKNSLFHWFVKLQ
jgi:hypothetical protein